MAIEQDAYDRLRGLMARRGISNRWLGQRAGINESVVSRSLKLGKGFDGHWAKIAEALDVSLDWLVRGVGDPWHRADLTFGKHLDELLAQRDLEPQQLLELLDLPSWEAFVDYTSNAVAPAPELARRWADALGLRDRQRSYFLWLASNPFPDSPSNDRELDEPEPLQAKAMLPVAVREAGTVYIAAPKNGGDGWRPPFAQEVGTLPLVGTVAAGSQLISYLNEPRTFRWRSSWAIMRVEGTSAYPVVYPNQFVIVDTDRPVRHNNLVIVETEEPDGFGKTRMNAYLKRYCRDLNAPDGFVLASVNSGLDSPYIPKERILVMAPIVGVLFEEGPETKHDETDSPPSTTTSPLQ